MQLYFSFFFSSRRRHTRWNCDWSSDVCSSDLPRARRRSPAPPPCARGAPAPARGRCPCTSWDRNRSRATGRAARPCAAPSREASPPPRGALPARSARPPRRRTAWSRGPAPCPSAGRRRGIAWCAARTGRSRPCRSCSSPRADALLLDAPAVLVVEHVEPHLLGGGGREELHGHVDQPEADRSAPDRSGHLEHLARELRDGLDPLRLARMGELRQVHAEALEDALLVLTQPAQVYAQADEPEQGLRQHRDAVVVELLAATEVEHGVRQPLLGQARRQLPGRDALEPPGHEVGGGVAPRFADDAADRHWRGSLVELRIAGSGRNDSAGLLRWASRLARA